MRPVVPGPDEGGGHGDRGNVRPGWTVGTRSPQRRTLPTVLDRSRNRPFGWAGMPWFIFLVLQFVNSRRFTPPLAAASNPDRIPGIAVPPRQLAATGSSAGKPSDDIAAGGCPMHGLVGAFALSPFPRNCVFQAANKRSLCDAPDVAYTRRVCVRCLACPDDRPTTRPSRPCDFLPRKPAKTPCGQGGPTQSERYRGPVGV